jgi:outer membrane protein
MSRLVKDRAAGWAWLVLVVMLAPGGAGADEGSQRLAAVSGPVHLTPEGAAAMAVERATEMALAEVGIATAEANVLLAETMRSWQAGLGASYSRMGPASSMPLPAEMGGGSITLAPTEVAQVQMTVTQPLYLGKRDIFSREAALAGQQAAKESREAAFLGIDLAARQLVYRVLQLQELAVVSQQRVTAVAEHKRLSEVMFEAGTLARFEVVQAETELARVRGDLIKSQTAVNQAQAALRQLLNLPQETELVVEGGVPATLPEGDQSDLIGLALQQRPEIAAQAALLRAQEHSLRLARVNDRSTVALQGSLSTQVTEGDSGDLSWNVTLGVSKPLYQGGVTRAKTAQAQAAVKSAQLQVEKAQQQVAFEVTQALLNWQDAQQSLAVARQGEIEALERLQIAEVRYRNGVSLGVEVLDAQTALSATRMQVVNAEYDLQVATVALRAAVGLGDRPKE